MPTNPFDFSKLNPANALYDKWEQGMTAWWEAVMKNPAFLGGMGHNMARITQMRTAYEAMVDGSLQRAHLPTRRDMVRVANVISLLEDKLLRVEDELLATQDKLVDMEKAALKARIEAAEAQLELTERLTRMEESLKVALAGREVA